MSMSLGVLIMRKKKLDILICVLLTIILLVFATQFSEITPIARIYPIGVMLGTFICILILLVQSIRSIRTNASQNTELMTAQVVKKIIYYILLILVYILLWEWLGYIITTFLFTLVSLLFLGMKNKTVLTLFPICITAVIYILFTNLLMVSLPKGIFIEMFL